MSELVDTNNGERSRKFNESCGTDGYMSAMGRTGANLHPDRCQCQGSDTTPRKHYSDPPYRCARCLECKGYLPLLATHQKGDDLQPDNKILQSARSGYRPPGKHELCKHSNYAITPELREFLHPAGHYRCACEGCWCCDGKVLDCTCDIDWDALYENNRL